MEEMVNKADIKLFRIRKTFLVNPLFITEYSVNREVIDNEIVLEIGRKYKETVKKHYLLTQTFHTDSGNKALMSAGWDINQLISCDFDCFCHDPFHKDNNQLDRVVHSSMSCMSSQHT